MNELHEAQAVLQDLENSGEHDAGAISRARKAAFDLAVNVERARMGEEIETPQDNTSAVQFVDKGKSGIDFAGSRELAESNAWLKSLEAAVNPWTGKRYTESQDAEGQWTRHAVFAGRTEVFRGNAIDAATRAEFDKRIAADQAEFAKAQAAKDVAELAAFRARNGQ